MHVNVRIYVCVHSCKHVHVHVHVHHLSVLYTGTPVHLYTCVYNIIILLYYCTQAMDELKVMLDDNNVDYSETELVINENGIPGGPLNASIEGLSDVFVSRFRSVCVHL